MEYPLTSILSQKGDEPNKTNKTYYLDCKDKKPTFNKWVANYKLTITMAHPRGKNGEK